MRATPSVTLRVTNSRPRRGDSWLNRMPAAGEQVVALAVVDGDPVAVDLGDAVGAARIERRGLASAGSRAPCRTSRSTTPGRSGCVGSTSADRVEHARDAERGELAGQHRLLSTTSARMTGPRGCRPRRGRASSITADQRELVEQVGLVQVEPGPEVLDPLEVLRAGAADHAADGVALFQQQLREVGAVLAGDAGDQCPSNCRPPSAVSAADGDNARCRLRHFLIALQ